MKVCKFVAVDLDSQVLFLFLCPLIPKLKFLIINLYIYDCLGMKMTKKRELQDVQVSHCVWHIIYL
jgi:hypothetical protein